MAATLAAPALIKSAGAQGATIKIGMVLPVTGSAAEQGKFWPMHEKLFAHQSELAREDLDRYAREIPRGQLAREAGLLRAEAVAARDAGP